MQEEACLRPLRGQRRLRFGFQNLGRDKMLLGDPNDHARGMVPKRQKQMKKNGDGEDYSRHCSCACSTRITKNFLSSSPEKLLPTVKETLVVCPVIAAMQWFREIERCTTRGSNNILFIMVPEWRNAHYIQSVDSNATKAVLDLESTYNEIWYALKAIHLAKEASSKKFLVSNYMEFKMVDDKLIIEHVQEFQLISNKIAISRISQDENFHVGAIVSKLLPSWKECRSKLLHKKEDLTLEQLLQHLQIEQETIL
ncbi:uncharacterized protein [Solanum lycopersicum]|uniref:uncharacterized protein n=1 Tax=Solanum lycopersicum TaxID=4081 RepID=UPI0008FEC1F2|nr:uncharacterized protein LOC109120713 [Solanum lycopersicum]